MTPAEPCLGDALPNKAHVLVYVINSFDRGGAESGLIALLDGGFFASYQLRIVALARGIGGLEAALAERGYPPYILVDRARMRVVDLPQMYFRLRRFLRDVRPTVVIGSLPQANLLARLSLASQSRVLFVSFEHNTHLAKRAYEIGFLLTSWRVDRTFADSAPTLDTAFERLYWKRPAAADVIPLVSFPTAAKRSGTARPAGTFRLAHAGRFTPVKNQASLIEAVALLTQRGRDVALTLYGDGPERARCEHLAKILGVNSRVRFAGFVSDWFREAADLFVVASRYEGLCIVALEAMHAGIAVAAPPIGGLRDYAGADTSFVLDSVAPGHIADTVAMVMESETLARAKVTNAAEMIDRRFGSDEVRTIYRTISRNVARDVAKMAWKHSRQASKPVELTSEQHER